MPRSSLIIVNYNTADHTARLVAQATGAVDEVIVVDNASPEGDATVFEAMASHRRDVRLLALADNRGYGAGANVGANAASGDVLLIANPDVDLGTATLDHLVAAVSEPGVGLASPRFLHHDGTLQRSAHHRDPGLLSTIFELCRPLAAAARRIAPDWHPTLLSSREHMTSRDCAHVLGAFMALRREAFEQVTGFDEGFFLYREETDLCHRLRSSGWRIRHVAECTVVHEGGVSMPVDTPAMYRPTYLASHYRYIAKHRGRAVAALARVLGTLACVIWVIAGPKRRLAWTPLGWHLGLRPKGPA